MRLAVKPFRRLPHFAKLGRTPMALERRACRASPGTAPLARLKGVTVDIRAATLTRAHSAG
jgi:hypothetical protein